MDDSVAQSTTITVTAVNDEPTVTSPIPDVTVDEDAADTVFSLYPYFQDVENTDAQLTYTVTGNTNPSLFTSVNITDPTNFTSTTRLTRLARLTSPSGLPIRAVSGWRTRSMSPSIR